MREYFIDDHGADLLSTLDELLVEVMETTEELAQYVAKKHDRDRYGFLDKIAHCSDYYYLEEAISKCFGSLSENQQKTYFRI